MNSAEQAPPPMGSKPPKKQRTEAQQAAFKAAVDKLKVKREQEREAKASARAELDLQKIEEKAQVLKTRVKPKAIPTVVAAPPSPETVEIVVAPYVSSEHKAPAVDDILKHVERLLDERLPKKATRRRARSPSSSPERERPARRIVKQEQHHAPQSLPPAWYDSLFPQRR